MKGILEYLPTVKRITLGLIEPPRGGVDAFDGLNKENLNKVGFNIIHHHSGRMGEANCLVMEGRFDPSLAPDPVIPTSLTKTAQLSTLKAQPDESRRNAAFGPCGTGS